MSAFVKGRLTRDPVEAFSRTNTPVCKATVAVKGKGCKEEYINITAIGRETARPLSRMHRDSFVSVKGEPAEVNYPYKGKRFYDMFLNISDLMPGQEGVYENSIEVKGYVSRLVGEKPSKEGTLFTFNIGVKKEGGTDYLKINAFDELAEWAKYLRKGIWVTVIGRLHSYWYKTELGKTVYGLEIRAEDIII